ncbi:MAG: DNA mismatch repair protein MutS [Dehalococcoidia bacterium]|nr:DNA mismatch repair protein MutS [Dehalococcoidia bacterium]
MATSPRSSTGGSARSGAHTPARQQYLDLKAQHPDALLLIRMGDFYETFDADAETAARVLGIVLTSRPMGGAAGGAEARVPLAGIPHHQLERYLDQLVAAGLRVAIADQTSVPPSKGGAPGLVERRITRVVTPGTVDRGALLTERGNNWLVAIAPVGAPAGEAPGEGARWGLAACDVTTGELELSLAATEALAGEWARLAPREVLLAEGTPATVLAAALGALPDGALRTERPAREFRPDRATAALAERLGVASLEGYGLEAFAAAVGAAGAIVAYLAATWPQALAHLRAPRAVRAADVVYLDPQTRRNLELFAPSAGGGAPGGGAAGAGSLVETLDRTLTAMGARLLRARLGRPLRAAAAADALLDEVAAFVDAPLPRSALRGALRGLPDFERLLGRVRAGSAGARQLVQLRRGLEALPALRARAVEAGAAAAAMARGLAGGGEAAAAIAAALDDDPPAEVGEGATVRDGFDAEVDRLRALASGARDALAALETAERARSGIATLRVGYHRVFGYYLECGRGQAERAPADYEPRQTLANAQRFRFAALAALETEILGAKEALLEAERGVLDRARAQAAAAGAEIERAAAAVARLDVAAALAEAAADGGYVRPELAEGGAIVIEGGRHPVVERGLPRGAFVPNDVSLGGGAGGGMGGGADIIVLTGPNMGGKSTYLRQTALIVLMAQCGVYVPATRARVAMVDRIFSRVGAQDDIASGRSTFMVEMLETATILHNATERSLVILDEVGRGTATYDGLAIARAVLEHLHHRPGGTPKTLFATHYHELTALSGTLPRVANRAVAVREEEQEIVLLHRVVEGGADRSYGVHVAALAGLPRPVVARARELLADLEAAPLAGASAAPSTGGRGAARAVAAGAQLALVAAAADEALLRELAALDADALTPLAALQRLYELRAAARRRLGVEG